MTISLPSFEAFNGPDGSERLHQVLDELTKDIPDDLSGSVTDLQAQITALEAKNTALQAQVDGLVIPGEPSFAIVVFREENVGLNRTLGREIVHNLDTLNTVVSVEMGGSDSTKSWVVSESVGFQTTKDQLSIYFSAAPILNFNVTIVGFKEN